MTTLSITSNQRKQVVRFMEDGLDALRLDKDGAQRIIENGGEFQVGLKELIQKFSIPNQFADEEVRSSYTYPESYKPRDIAEQVATLKSLFPELDATYDAELATQPLPPNAEGWFAIPRWEKLASTYGKAVDKMLAAICSSRTFCNHCKSQTGQEYLRQHVKTEKAFQKLAETQKGDILIVAAQYGMRHRGRSVRRARECFVGNEFGLGAFAVGCMALVHPERYVRWKELDTDCAGDEFAPDADGRFSRGPVFSFGDGRVRFYACWFGDARDFYGSVSAFIPQ